MAGTRAKPSDFTGAQRQKAAAEAAEELKERQGQIALARQVEIDREETDVFDPATAESVGTLESLVLDDSEREEVIIVLEDIEDMTYGAGTHYSFEAGRKYKVRSDLAEYLDSIGYLASRQK